MIYNQEDQEFLEKIAPTRTGKHLLRVLNNIETFYADVRNIGVEPTIRIDALKILKDALIDKLKLLGREPNDPPKDEWK